jgi:hypothetical protein
MGMNSSERSGGWESTRVLAWLDFGVFRHFWLGGQFCEGGKSLFGTLAVFLGAFFLFLAVAEWRVGQLGNGGGIFSTEFLQSILLYPS